MEQRNPCSGSGLLSCFFFCLLPLLMPGTVRGYKNYTVGDSLGWFDNLEKSKIDYQKWAAGKQFTLGDFLIFNTDTNHSVIQTYNYTTYKLCDYSDAQDDDTTQWSGGDPSATEPRPVTVAVPLLKEGLLYFFSGDYDGEQCENGQQFKIKVSHGEGLPPSLKTPSGVSSPSPAGSPEAEGGGDDSTPDPSVPANFNHPKGLPPHNRSSDDDEEDDKDSSASFSVLVHVKIIQRTFHGVLVLLWLLHFQGM